jgi:hypothetical protein
MSTSLLLIGNIGGTEVLLLSLIPLLLLFGLIRRLFRSSKPAVVMHQASATISVADELRKLQVLREQGVLTEAEFTEQKRRLLH